VNRPADEKHPKMKKEKMRWPLMLIWLIPVLATAGAGIYLYEYLQDRGPLITISFNDGSGLRAGETIVSHRGVQIGKVSSIYLDDDQKQVIVAVQLAKQSEAFAKKGATFWVVRPEISTESITGLTTITSGPYIDSTPGDQEEENQFTGLDRAPSALGPGMKLILHTPKAGGLQVDSPVYYRGIQVGVIHDIQLSEAADGVDVHVFVRQRYVPLVRNSSQFWVASGFDLKGGIFTGVQVKLDSLRSLLSGGVAFATPDKEMGDVAADGAEFPLFDEPKKEWLDWSPKIELAKDGTGGNGLRPLPTAAQEVRAAVK
jgi:paraquat-inducible protein B